jgi:outer membrane protein assembly factor BamE (lipoprotein component of BamABCDE complex)
MNRGFLFVSAALLAIAGAAACSPVTTYSGYGAEGNTAETADPQVGVDTRATVQQRFGSPSTTAIFDQTAWYYVSAVQERMAFYHPRTTERHVMVVRFDGDLVSSVEKFGLDRGRVIAYDENVTPTRGRELGLLEQLLGNVGSRPIRTQDEDESESPRRN